MKTNDINRTIHEMAKNISRQRSEVLVIALVGRNNSDMWWNSPNKAFDYETPNDMWELDFHRVYNYLMHHGFVGGGS